LLKTTETLAVVILTLDEEKNLPACLASLDNLTTCIAVVDSGSTDTTIAIAKRAGATVMSHSFKNYSDQRNWAIQQIPEPVEWILHLDADERLTPELKHEIAKAISPPSGEIAGYMFSRRTVFMGRWIRHGGHYPCYHLRLVRRTESRCEDRLYDQHFTVQGKVEKLRGDLIDLVGSDLRSWTERHARWAQLEAADVERNRQGATVEPRLNGTPIERKRWAKKFVYGLSPPILRPFLYWIYRYFLRLGFLDGIEGLIFHFLQGLWFRFLIDAAIFENKKFSTRENTPPDLDHVEPRATPAKERCATNPQTEEAGDSN
jgi:glycosyltransferase involved in cell wall biosynthesis